MTQKNYVIYLYAFQILIWVKNNLLMQKFYIIKPGIDALKQAAVLALMRLGLEALIRFVIKTQKLYSIRPSVWRCSKN